MELMKALRLRAETATINQTRSSRASDTWINPSVHIESTPLPSLQNDELLIKVSYCGLCGSDFHLAESDPTKKSMVYPGLVELPVTIGHEFSGQVVGHGSSIADADKMKFPLGSYVTAEEMQWCGDCGACRKGLVNHCENLEELGFTRNGAHAEFIAVRPKYCWSIDSLIQSFGMDDGLKLGALIEPYAVAYRALFLGAHKQPWLRGNRVLIVGAGPIGLACLDLALYAEATEIAVIEKMKDRRDFSKQFGADRAFTAEEKISASLEFDWIIDAAGDLALVLEIAKTNLAIGGTICLLARSPEKSSIDPELLITKNAKIFGSQGHSGDSNFQKVIELMAKQKLNALALVREVINIEEAAKKLQSQKKCEGKTLVCFS